MSGSRERILNRIRAIERAETEPVTRSYRHAGTLSADSRLALFCERVADYQATVIQTADPSAAIAGICRECRVTRLGVPVELPSDWRPEVEIIEDHSLTPAELDLLDGALTGCTVGIAETGTLVLVAGAEQGRRALTLVPDLHICVVRESQIVETVTEAVELLRNERRPITFISGPSATSDIELSRVEGVHGPRKLVVVVEELMGRAGLEPATLGLKVPCSTN